MADDSGKQKGRNAALQIVNKFKTKQPAPQEPVSLDTDALVEAIEALSKNNVDLSPIVEALENSQPEALDLSPLIEAIAAIEMSVGIDLKPVTAQIQALAEKSATDFKPVVDKLDEIKKAMEKNTDVLSELVAVAKSSKFVKYDTMGRIIEIGFKE